MNLLKSLSLGVVVSLVTIGLTSCATTDNTQGCISLDRGEETRQIPDSIPNVLTIEPDQNPERKDAALDFTDENLRDSLRYFSQAETSTYVETAGAMTSDTIAVSSREYPRSGVTVQAEISWHEAQEATDWGAGVKLTIKVPQERIGDEFLADSLSTFVEKGGIIHADGKVFELPYFDESEFFCGQAPYGTYMSEYQSDGEYYEQLEIEYLSFDQDGPFDLPESKAGPAFQFTPKELIFAIAADSNAYLKLDLYGFEQRYFLNESGYVTNAVYAASAVEANLPQGEYGILWAESPSSKLFEESKLEVASLETADPDSPEGILSSFEVKKLDRPSEVKDLYDEKYEWELVSNPRCLTSRSEDLWVLEVCLDELFTFQRERGSFLRVGITVFGETNSATAAALCEGIQIEGDSLFLNLDGRSGCPPIFLIDTETLEQPEEFLMNLARESFVVRVPGQSGEIEYEFSNDTGRKQRESFERLVLARQALIEGIRHPFFN